MPTERSQETKFTGTVSGTEKAGVYIVLPFDPATVWGVRSRYHVAGTINGIGVRAVIEKSNVGHYLTLGAAWRRDRGVAPGDHVDVLLALEGPQRANLASDIAAALEANPDAAGFFDSIAQFYRKGYLRWIDATKRSPDERARRIAELVKLLEAGKKERPQ